MKAEAMERNDGDERGQSLIWFVRMPFCLRAGHRLPIFWKTIAGYAGGGALSPVRTLSRFGKFLKSSHLRPFCYSPLSTSCSIVFPIPQRSLAFNGKLVQNKGYEAME